jgi:hypothetical protein
VVDTCVCVYCVVLWCLVVDMCVCVVSFWCFWCRLQWWWWWSRGDAASHDGNAVQRNKQASIIPGAKGRSACKPARRAMQPAIFCPNTTTYLHAACACRSTQHARSHSLSPPMHARNATQANTGRHTQSRTEFAPAQLPPDVKVVERPDLAPACTRCVVLCWIEGGGEGG